LSVKHNLHLNKGYSFQLLRQAIITLYVNKTHVSTFTVRKGKNQFSRLNLSQIYSVYIILC